MLTSRLLVVLAGAWLLASGAGAAPEAPGGPMGVRRIELRADARSAPPEVRIRPGYSTTLFFDAPIQPEQVELEGRERFLRVGIAEDHLALIPSSGVRQGERLRLQVRFRDGALPESAAVFLVVDSTQVEQQVELYRHPRTAESYRQEVEALKTELIRLRQEAERLRGVPLSAWSMEFQLAVFESPQSLQRQLLRYQQLSSPFRLDVVRAAALIFKKQERGLHLVLQLRSEEAEWTAVGAALMDAQGQLVKLQPPWQPGPARFRQAQSLVVLLEDETKLREARYTLKLWDAGGRTVTLEGLTAGSAP